jgi:hypothetical protein
VGGCGSSCVGSFFGCSTAVVVVVGSLIVDVSVCVGCTATVSVMTVDGLVSRGRAGAGRGRDGVDAVDGGIDGIVPASVPGGSDAPVVVIIVFVIVKLVVVSAFVPVSGAETGGGATSPGPLIVDVTPLAEPSCTVSYCWSFRATLSLLRQPASAMALTTRTNRLDFMTFTAVVEVARCMPVRIATDESQS